MNHCFSFFTIEAWYYKAKCQDPIVALGKKNSFRLRGSIVFTPELIRMLGRQYEPINFAGYNLQAERSQQNLGRQ